MTTQDDFNLGSRARAIEAAFASATYAILPIASLVRWARNPRTGMEEGSAKLASTIDAVGWGADVLVQRGTLRVIAGHLRLLAAERLGIERVPCKILDVDDELADEIALADNRAQSFARWDDEKLLAMLDEMDPARRDVLGWSRKDCDDLLTDIQKARRTATDGDDVPDQVEPRSKLGDVWELGDHVVVCADATDPATLPLICSAAQCLLTDPPYNVGYVGKTAEKLTIQNDKMGDAAYYAFLVAALRSAFAVLEPGRAWYIWHADTHGYTVRGALIELRQQLRQCLVWSKQQLVLGRSDYQWQHEPCLYGWAPGASHVWLGGRDKTTLLAHPKPSASRDHPTMKPVALLAEQINNSTRPGEIVMDMFLGSGSTLMACEATGRACRGVELDPHYVDVILTRWEEWTNRKAVLR